MRLWKNELTVRCLGEVSHANWEHSAALKLHEANAHGNEVKLFLRVGCIFQILGAGFNPIYGTRAALDGTPALLFVLAAFGPIGYLLRKSSWLLRAV